MSKEKEYEHNGRPLLYLNLDSKDKPIEVRQAVKKGFIEMIDGGVCDLSFPSSKLRRGRVQGDGTICPTITSNGMFLCVVEVQDD